jgi:hypothetical protein
MLEENFRELRKGEVHDGMKVWLAPPRYARLAGERMPISLGIMRPP